MPVYLTFPGIQPRVLPGDELREKHTEAKHVDLRCYKKERMLQDNTDAVARRAQDVGAQNQHLSRRWGNLVNEISRGYYLVCKDTKAMWMGERRGAMASPNDSPRFLTSAANIYG